MLLARVRNSLLWLWVSSKSRFHHWHRHDRAFNTNNRNPHQSSAQLWNLPSIFSSKLCRYINKPTAVSLVPSRPFSGAFRSVSCSVYNMFRTSLPGLSCRPKSDTDYRIFNVRTWSQISLLHAHTHRVGHTDSKSAQRFWLFLFSLWCPLIRGRSPRPVEESATKTGSSSVQSFGRCMKPFFSPDSKCPLPLPRPPLATNMLCLETLLRLTNGHHHHHHHHQFICSVWFILDFCWYNLLLQTFYVAADHRFSFLRFFPRKDFRLVAAQQFQSLSFVWNRYINYITCFDSVQSFVNTTTFLGVQGRQLANDTGLNSLSTHAYWVCVNFP